MPCSKHYCGYKGGSQISEIDYDDVVTNFFRCCHHGGVHASQDDEKHSFLFLNSAEPSSVSNKVKVWSAYNGEVFIDCLNLGNGDIMLFSSVKGLGGRDIFIKQVDAVKNGLDPQNKDYTLSDLNACLATKVNISQCEKNAKVIADLKPRKSTLTPLEMTELENALIYNAAVDSHFNTSNFVSFMHNVLKINNIDRNRFLVTVHNVPKLDNAYFTGSFIVAGNGDDMFFPLVGSDVIAHEWGHGLVQRAANLIYLGHAGALNEHYADSIGTAFEFYLANKLKIGTFDWTIGEDFDRRDYLRNMSNPKEKKQPEIYQGTFWANPNNELDDYGGVHRNSGVGNNTFFKSCKQLDDNVLDVLNVFFEALRNLPPLASFLHYRDSLKQVSQMKGKKYSKAITTVLNEVGLTDTAVNDWAKAQPASSRGRGRRGKGGVSKTLSKHLTLDEVEKPSTKHQKEQPRKHQKEQPRKKRAVKRQRR